MLLSKIIRTGLVTEPLNSDSARLVELTHETANEIRRHLGRALAIREVDAGSCRCLNPAMWVMVDHEGRLFRVKLRDPSFANWPALSFALLKNIVPGFPLCNESFNQSYSGNDL